MESCKTETPIVCDICGRKYTEQTARDIWIILCICCVCLNSYIVLAWAHCRYGCFVADLFTVLHVLFLVVGCFMFVVVPVLWETYCRPIWSGEDKCLPFSPHFRAFSVYWNKQSRYYCVSRRLSCIPACPSSPECHQSQTTEVGCLAVKHSLSHVFYRIYICKWAFSQPFNVPLTIQIY